jgi:peptidyl-prolyl cis-trans isomerase D
MLKQLRKKKTAKKIWIVLTVLILPAFLFWGFGSFLRSKQGASDYAGKILGRRVPFQEYQDAADAVKNLMIIQFGDKLAEAQKNVNVGSLAWERLLLLTEARKRRIKISDREVVEAIANYPFFQRNGKFDNQIYSQTLQYVFRTQPRIFEEQTRTGLEISKLYKDVSGNLSVNEDEIKKEYKKLNEQVSIYYIASLANDFAKGISPSEKEIKDYFTKNSLHFKEPLSFNLEYASIPSEDKNEAAIKDKVKKLDARLNKKEDFAKAAKDLNLQVKETGLFGQEGPIPGIGWSPQILSLIAKLKVGEFAAPVYVDKNYYLLRLKERKESFIPDFEAIKDKVKGSFIKDKAQMTAQKKIDDCLKELQDKKKADPKSVDFDKVAKACGLKSDSTGLFKYGSYIEGIGASDVFFSNAQSLEADSFSGVIETPTGLYIIKLKSKTPIDEKKFLEEKPEFAKKLLVQKKDEYFTKFLEELRTKAQLPRD